MCMYVWIAVAETNQFETVKYSLLGLCKPKEPGASFPLMECLFEYAHAASIAMGIAYYLGGGIFRFDANNPEQVTANVCISSLSLSFAFFHFLFVTTRLNA